jgi:UDP-N-acetylmuramoylalanine--D-glutamate ligase
VTGTNGKTTTTTLLDRLLKDARLNPVTAGNIGTAFSSVIDDVTASSLAVLEVSSFQLDFVRRFKPAVAVLLNITPDHLDRYDHDFSKYSDAKCRVFENQGAGDVLIYNDDDPETRRQVLLKAAGRMKTLPFALERRSEEGAFVENGTLVTVIGGKRTEIIDTGMISIRGTHNLYNSMAAVLAAQSVRASAPSIRATLRNFKGVEHRLEFVREVDGVIYVNDSKATNVDSVWYALQSFREPIIVLLGGRDKGNEYSRLNDLVKKHVKAIVAIGESAAKVSGAFGNIATVVTAGTMPEAVEKARGLAVRGDVVLLSPACASFDWFENYEHRGRVFKEIVTGLR